MGKFLAVASFHNNPDEHIDLTINNVLKQTHQDWILIVGDDHSTDKDFKRRLKKKVADLNDPRIIYYQLEKRRELYLYQNMFLEYQYDYFFDLDSDDVLDPMLFETYDRHYIQFTEVQSIFSDYHQVTPDGNLEQWSLVKPVEDYLEEWNFRHYGNFWEIYSERSTQKMFGHARSMRRVDTKQLPILKECKTSTDTYFLFYNLTRGKHLHIPRNLYTYINRPGSDSSAMTIEEHTDFNLNASFCMDQDLMAASDHYSDVWTTTSAISTCEWLSQVDSFSVWSDKLTATQQQKIRFLYPDKQISFNEAHVNLIVDRQQTHDILLEEINTSHIKRVSILCHNENEHDTTEQAFKETRHKQLAQVWGLFPDATSYEFFRQTRLTVDRTSNSTPDKPRTVVILKDTIISNTDANSIIETINTINMEGSEAYLLEVRTGAQSEYLKQKLQAHYYTPDPQPFLADSLREFIESKQPDLLQWNGASIHLSDSTSYWLLNNYWSCISSQEILGENLPDYLLKVSIPEVPKARFYHRSGPEVHIDTMVPGHWEARFYIGDVQHWSIRIKEDFWARANTSWSRAWECQIYNVDTETIAYSLKPDLTMLGIQMDSSSLGDTLSWMGQIEEVIDQHDYERLVVRTHKPWLFNWIDLKRRGIHHADLKGRFGQNYQEIGVYMDDKEISRASKHPRDWRTIPLGAIAADQLGITYRERRPTMARKFLVAREIKSPSVTIATHATAQAKYWNHPTGWQTLVDEFNERGWGVYYTSSEEPTLDGVEWVKDLVEVAQTMNASGKFIGISSGLSWLAWAIGVDVCMISGFTWEFVEFECDVRIINKSVCSGCWTWTRFDRGNWNWCPQNEGTERQFECTKTITPAYVLKELETSGWFNV